MGSDFGRRSPAQGAFSSLPEVLPPLAAVEVEPRWREQCIIPDMTSQERPNGFTDSGLESYIGDALRPRDELC